jgi:catechol 2,3-dioxygenase-like lactoylglutathione lyase family enzyme
MRLRQIALVARDLAKARTDIAAVLGIDYAYVDPAVGKYGLTNVVFPVGDTFLEVVSPIAAGTTAGRLLDKRGGDGGYMVILQVPDVGAARDRVRACGVRIVDQLDRDGVAMTHLHPKDTGGAILSLDYMHPEEHWEWGGPNWQDHVNTEISLRITAAEMKASDPVAMATRWASVLGLVTTKECGVDRIALQGGEIRFVAVEDGRKEGLFAIDVVVCDADAVRVVAARRGLVDGDGAIVLAGTRIRLIQTK